MQLRKRLTETAVFIVLLLATTLLIECEGSDKEIVDKELDQIRTELDSLRRLKYDVRSLEAEFAALRNQLNKKHKVEEPIRNTSFTPDGSHLDDPFLGSKIAPVIMMAFGDFQCRPCRAFYHESLPQLKKEFVETNFVKFIYRDFPLDSHIHAAKAATLAHCAGEQGEYWQTFSILFDNPELVDAGDFDALRSKIKNVDSSKLNTCLTSFRYQTEIKRDVNEALALGAKGAPGFFIGVEEENGGLRGVFVRGAQPYPVLKAEISKLIAKANQQE